VIDERQLGESLGVTSVRLLNDLESIAYAIPRLMPEDLHALNVGQPASKGAIAVIAPGTGLGEAFLTWERGRYCAHASEGGHTDFAPTDILEWGLLRYLWDRYEHVSYERVCSGLGLPNIYAYLKDSGQAEEPTWLADRLANAHDATPIIVNNALNKDECCELCERTLRTFVSILGAEAGNLALKTLATGGVYLGGGIPPRILPALDRAVFMRAFLSKGRFEEFLARVPVYVILNPRAPLLGAAAYGLEMDS
jgi:glucokinase